MSQSDATHRSTHTALLIVGSLAIACGIAGGYVMMLALDFTEIHVVKMYDELETEGAVIQERAAEIAGEVPPVERFQFAQRFLLGDGHAIRHASVCGYGLSGVLIGFGGIVVWLARPRNERTELPQQQSQHQ